MEDKLTYSEAKKNIPKRKKYEGKVLDEIGYDEYGHPVAYGFTCTKPGCNCTGGWWEGDEGSIHKTLKLC